MLRKFAALSPKHEKLVMKILMVIMNFADRELEIFLRFLCQFVILSLTDIARGQISSIKSSIKENEEEYSHVKGQFNGPRIAEQFSKKRKKSTNKCSLIKHIHIRLLSLRRCI